MSRLWTDAQLTEIDTALTQLEADRRSNLATFLAGAGLQRVRRMQGGFAQQVPDNLTPNTVVARWRSLVDRVNSIANG
jgi:hypothetical protein